MRRGVSDRKRGRGKEGHIKSEKSDVVASLFYERRQGCFILAKVNGVTRFSVADSGIDYTVVEQSIAKQLKKSINPNFHKTYSIGDKPVKLIGSLTPQFSLQVEGNNFHSNEGLRSGNHGFIRVLTM